MRAVVVFCILAAAAGACGGQAYPSKPVRWIVPYPPGGGSDLAARVIAQKLSAAWGQQVLIDNRGGAASVIGTQLAARSPADGYTFLFAVSTFIVVPLLNTRAPYDPARDFTPVGLVAVNPFLLAAASSLPANSVKDLIALAKASPGKLNYGSSGSGGPNHLSMELFKTMTGTDIVHVPYKGAGPAIADLLGGQVQLLMNNLPPFQPHLKSGKLKALAVTGAERSRSAPDIPTVAEAGVPGYRYTSWYALLAPAGIPPAVVKEVNARLAGALADTEVAGLFTTQGFEPRSSTPQELAGFMRDDTERLRKVIRAAGIRMEEGIK